MSRPIELHHRVNQRLTSPAADNSGSHGLSDQINISTHKQNTVQRTFDQVRFLVIHYDLKQKKSRQHARANMQI